MLAPMLPPIPAPSGPLPLAIQSFLAGILVALALLAILAYQPLRDRVLSQTGLFGLDRLQRYRGLAASGGA